MGILVIAPTLTSLKSLSGLNWRETGKPEDYEKGRSPQGRRRGRIPPSETTRVSTHRLEAEPPSREPFPRWSSSAAGFSLRTRHFAGADSLARPGRQCEPLPRWARR